MTGNDPVQSSSLPFLLADTAANKAERASGTPWRVLVVDDDDAMQHVTSLALGDYVYRGRPLELLTANSGEAARLILADETDIAVVLLDVVMETEDAGLRLVRWIRDELGNHKVRIVIRTGEAQTDLRQIVLNYDINDFQVKTDLTFDRLFVVMTSALRAYNEILLAEEAASLREATRVAEAETRVLARYIERIQFELSLAQTMQLSIMPEADRIRQTAETYRLAIDAHFEPSSELGGDYWTLVEIDERRLAVLLADFSGHGVAAAINTFLLHSLIGRTQPDDADPAAWFVNLNAALHKFLPIGNFATAFLGVLDIETGTLSYATAAAPTAILVRSADAPKPDRRFDLFIGSGPLLGPLEAPPFETRTAQLNPGDALVLYSDALTETRDAADFPDADIRVRDRIDAALDKTHSLEALIEDFFATEARPPRDDLTVVWLTRRR